MGSQSQTGLKRLSTYRAKVIDHFCYDHFMLGNTAVIGVVLVIVILAAAVLVAQSCPTLYDPMDCSSPGSSVHGILQARIVDLVAILVSRGSSQPRD